MRDISGADFRFAKTLTLPFFGSGMVDLPPGGVKRVKNSRKMQMVFFVFYGRVTVDLGSPMQNFSIGKGGMWQVPRGKVLVSLLDLFVCGYNSSAKHDGKWVYGQSILLDDFSISLRHIYAFVYPAFCHASTLRQPSIPP